MLVLEDPGGDAFEEKLCQRRYSAYGVRKTPACLWDAIRAGLVLHRRVHRNSCTTASRKQRTRRSPLKTAPGRICGSAVALPNPSYLIGRFVFLGVRNEMFQCSHLAGAPADQSRMTSNSRLHRVCAGTATTNADFPAARQFRTRAPMQAIRQNQTSTASSRWKRTRRQ